MVISGSYSWNLPTGNQRWLAIGNLPYMYIYTQYIKWMFKAGETIELSLITKEELGLQPQEIISEDGE